MSSFSLRSLALIVLAAAAMVLSACTVTPLHGDRAVSGSASIALSHAAPSSRLEQVFYQSVAARITPSASSTVPVLSATVSTASSRIGLSTRTEPATDHQVIATISYRIENNGQLLASGTRTATATYRRTGQIIADDAARQNADEEAVRAAAQSVIAAILADPALR